MAARAILRHLRMTPRKVREVADGIRGQTVEKALDYLKFCPRSAAVPLSKLVRSAMANAQQQKGVDVDRLFVKTLMVDGGTPLKRSLARSRGRTDPILKRTSHITLVLEQKE